MRDLATAAAAASEGNYSQTIAVERGDEVGRLAEAFNHLLSELREKQDMETYIGELSRTLPSGNGHAAMEDAGTRPVALLGIDMRRYAQPKIGIDPESTIDQLAQDLRTKDGVLLIVRDATITANNILQIRKFEQLDGSSLEISVKILDNAA